MDKLHNLISDFVHQPTTKTKIVTETHPRVDDTRKMAAVTWKGSKKVEVTTKPQPLVTQEWDCIVRVTTTTICGSDLHLYTNSVPSPGAMKVGDVLGHEAVGIVESVGPAVRSVKPGDRVAVSAVIACGNCEFCKKQQFSLCDFTNPSGQMEKLYGCRISALFGYSQLTGDYPGTQAEFVRVPNADLCVLKLPDNVSDDQAIFLSDVFCTGWHANELGEVTPGRTVVVWGCGPIGLTAAYLAKKRGASKVISVDHVPLRLQTAKKYAADEVINFETQDVVSTIHELIPGGPDVCIDCVGFRFPKSALHKMMHTLKLETDAVDVTDEAIRAVKKGGNLSIIGDYFAYANMFPIGAMMEKAITVRGGQLYTQKYWKFLLSKIASGEFDPTWLITHRVPLEEAAQAYRMFCDEPDRAIKVLLRTRFFGAEKGPSGSPIGVGAGGPSQPLHPQAQAMVGQQEQLQSPIQGLAPGQQQPPFTSPAAPPGAQGHAPYQSSTHGTHHGTGSASSAFSSAAHPQGHGQPRRDGDGDARM